MVDEIERDDLEDEPGRTRLPDSIRRALLTGLSAVMVTEEGIRSALGDMRLPKEALAYLAQQTDRTRRDLFRSVSDEIKGWLKGIDLTGELRKALTGLTIDVKAEITFSERGEPVATLKTEMRDRDDAPRPAPRRRTRGRTKKTRKRT